MSAAGELRVNENSATVECVGILTDVSFLVVVLGLSESIDQVYVMRYDIHSIGGCVQVVTEVRLLVLLGVPDA